MARTIEEERLRKKIKSQQALYGYSNPDMAVKMRMTMHAWNDRLMHPRMFKLLELLRLQDVLHINVFEEVSK